MLTTVTCCRVALQSPRRFCQAPVNKRPPLPPGSLFRYLMSQRRRSDILLTGPATHRERPRVEPLASNRLLSALIGQTSRAGCARRHCPGEWLHLPRDPCGNSKHSPSRSLRLPRVLSAWERFAPLSTASDACMAASEPSAGISPSCRYCQVRQNGFLTLSQEEHPWTCDSAMNTV
jgi:hypothetical protein